MEDNKEIKFINMRQVSKFQNGKFLFELNDDLKRTGWDEKEKQEVRDNFGNIHAKYSAMKVVARDYSNGTGEKLIDLELRLYPESIKTIAEDITIKINQRKAFKLELDASAKAESFFKTSIESKKANLSTLIDDLKKAGNDEIQTKKINQEIEKLKEDINFAKMSFANTQFNYQLCTQKIELMTEKVYEEQKIAPTTIKDSQYSNVTNITIEYNTKMNSPWTIIVQNGLGIREKTATGGFKVKTGSYKNGKQVKMFLGDNDIRKLFRKCRDYIVEWETNNQPNAIKQRAKYEKEDREARNNA